MSQLYCYRRQLVSAREKVSSASIRRANSSDNKIFYLFLAMLHKMNRTPSLRTIKFTTEYRPCCSGNERSFLSVKKSFHAVYAWCHDKYRYLAEVSESRDGGTICEAFEIHIS